jgi:heterodisulfide reductase subunit C
MPIHEKSLIRPENLHVQENIEIEGIDVSGHWSTFIESRVITDYNEDLEEEIAALPGGEFIHRCWQCGSCTNSHSPMLAVRFLHKLLHGKRN